MKHLTDDQLSARLDGALTGRPAEEAERHLAACASCRDALARLVALDADLKPALTRDPGEAYFASFAARVEDRLRAAGQGGAQRREWRVGIARLFGTPRGLAWAGAVAVVVGGAALVLVTGEHVQAPHLRDRDLVARGRQDAAPAPPVVRDDARPPAPDAARDAVPPAGAPARDAGFARPPAEEAKQEATTPEAANRLMSGPLAGARRATETRITEAGDPAPVPRAPGLAAPTPERAPAGQASEPPRLAQEADRVQKKALARPMQPAPQSALAPQDATGPAAGAPPELHVRGGRAGEIRFETAPIPEGEGRLCGEVRDARGRPVAGAQVVLADVARMATTDAAGAFCITAPVGEHPLTVYAIGFSESRQSVQIGAQESSVRMTLAAVPVLTGPGASWGAPPPLDRSDRERMGIALRSADGTALADSVRDEIEAARRIAATAAAGRSAAMFDAAAARFEHALRMAPGGPQELETRRELADARYQAWAAGATPQRAIAAIEALTLYANRAPRGAARDEAVQRLNRLRR